MSTCELMAHKMTPHCLSPRCCQISESLLFTVFRMLSITIKSPSLTLKAVGYGECVLCVGVNCVCLSQISPVMEAMQAGARGLCH